MFMVLKLAEIRHSDLLICSPLALSNGLERCYVVIVRLGYTKPIIWEFRPITLHVHILSFSYVFCSSAFPYFLSLGLRFSV